MGQAFEQRIYYLREFPNKTIIDELCRLAASSKASSSEALPEQLARLGINDSAQPLYPEHVRDCILRAFYGGISRAPFKLHLLYVVDAIVFNVGSPYTEILSEKLVDMCKNGRRALPIDERHKVDDLVSGWQSRKIPAEILRCLKRYVASLRKGASPIRIEVAGPKHPSTD